MKSSHRTFFALFLLALVSLACNRAYALVGVAPPTPPSVTVIAPTPTAIAATPTPAVETCFSNESWHPQESLCFIDDPDQRAAILPDYFNRVIVDLNVYQAPRNTIVPYRETVLLSFKIVDNQLQQPKIHYVPDSLKPLQDVEKAEQIWRQFAAIIPPDARPQLTEFTLFTDGGEESLAAVIQTENDPTQWALNVDPQDTQDYGELILTMVHEYGHLLTLNDTQVLPDLNVFAWPNNERVLQQAREKCTTYFTGEGCAREDAYIYAFYQEFWADIYDEWLAIDQIEDEDAYYEALDAFYMEHRDQFISDYAATNPAEDIAESWAYYVLQPLPAIDNNIAAEKIRFFHRYPELQSLRMEIIARIYSRLIRQTP